MAENSNDMLNVRSRNALSDDSKAKVLQSPEQLLSEAEKKNKKEHRFDTAKKNAGIIREKMNQLSERESEKYAEHPILHPLKRQLQLRAAVYGISHGVQAGAVLLPVALVNHRMNKNFKKEFGMGMLRYAHTYNKEYKKAMKKAFRASEFDSDFALVERKYGEFTGIKMQKETENWRTTVCEWFDCDEGAERLNQRDNDMRMHMAHEQDMLEKQLEMEKKREAEMRRMLLPMAIADYFRNPQVIKHWGNIDENGHPLFVTPIEQKAANYDDNFFNAGNPMTASANEGGETTDRNWNNNERPFENPVPNGPTPSPSPTSGGNAQLLTAKEVPLLGEHSEVIGPIPDNDDYVLVNISPDVLEAYTMMQQDLAVNSPMYEAAILRGRTHWKDLPNGVLYKDIQTLQQGAYTDYMMANIADGSILDMEDLQWYSGKFDEHWADFEQTQLLPEYGDRLNAYLLEQRAPSKSEQIMIDANENKFKAIEKGVEPSVAIEGAKKESAVVLTEYRQEALNNLIKNTINQRRDKRERDALPVAEEVAVVGIPDKTAGELNHDKEVKTAEAIALPGPVEDKTVKDKVDKETTEKAEEKKVEAPSTEVKTVVSTPVVEAGADEVPVVTTTTSGTIKKDEKKNHRKVPAGMKAIEAEARNLDRAENYVDAVRNRNDMKQVPVAEESDKTNQLGL